MDKEKIISDYEALCKITQDRNVIAFYLQSLNVNVRNILMGHIRQSAFEDVKHEQEMLNAGEAALIMNLENELLSQKCKKYGSMDKELRETYDAYGNTRLAKDSFLNYLYSQENLCGTLLRYKNNGEGLSAAEEGHLLEMLSEYRLIRNKLTEFEKLSYGGKPAFGEIQRYVYQRWAICSDQLESSKSQDEKYMEKRKRLCKLHLKDFKAKRVREKLQNE